MSDFESLEKDVGDLRLQFTELRARVDILQLALLGVVDRSKKAPAPKAEAPAAVEHDIPPHHMAVLRLIDEGGWTTAESLGVALGRSRKSIRLSVERLQSDGMLKKSGRLYVLTNFGKSAL